MDSFVERYTQRTIGVVSSLCRHQKAKGHISALRPVTQIKIISIKNRTEPSMKKKTDNGRIRLYEVRPETGKRCSGKCQRCGEVQKHVKPRTRENTKPRRRKKKRGRER